MKGELIVVGKTVSAHLAAGIDDYISRIAHYMPFAVSVVAEIRNTKSLSLQQQKEREGEKLLRLIQPNDYVVLLDERGKEYSSIAFADWLQRRQQQPQRLVFIVGGPYGFAESVYERADELLSLSKMTFSHQLVRLLFAEQLYRACTIIKGDPYHHQ